MKNAASGWMMRDAYILARSVEIALSLGLANAALPAAKFTIETTEENVGRQKFEPVGIAGAAGGCSLTKPGSVIMNKYGKIK